MDLGPESVKDQGRENSGSSSRFDGKGQEQTVPKTVSSQDRILLCLSFCLHELRRRGLSSSRRVVFQETLSTYIWMLSEECIAFLVSSQVPK